MLIQALKLLHPFMPFISEEIFCNLQEEEETIMVSQWPVYRDDWSFAKEEQSTETIKEAVRAIRVVRSSMNVPPSKKATVYVVSEDEGLLRIFEHSKSFFATLGYAGEVILQKNIVRQDDHVVFPAQRPDPCQRFSVPDLTHRILRVAENHTAWTAER